MGMRDNEAYIVLTETEQKRLLELAKHGKRLVQRIDELGLFQSSLVPIDPDDVLHRSYNKIKEAMKDDTS